MRDGSIPHPPGPRVVFIQAGWLSRAVTVWIAGAADGTSTLGADRGVGVGASAVSAIFGLRNPSGGCVHEPERTCRCDQRGVIASCSAWALLSRAISFSSSRILARYFSGSFLSCAS